MAWVYLLFAGLFEIVWVYALKQSQGFTRLWPTVGMIAAMVVSFFLLGLAVRTLPIGTAYAVWTGIGAIGAVLIGIVFFHDQATFGRLFFVSLIIVGVIGLKWVSA